MRTIIPVLIAVLIGQTLLARDDIVVGKVRVQLLSDSLARLELIGPQGFEDRNTFHVVCRNWPGTAFSTNVSGDQVVIRASNYVVRVPRNAASLDGVVIQTIQAQDSGRKATDSGLETVYKYEGQLTNSAWLPCPAETSQAWSVADTPRIIPPAWGLTPAPPRASRPETSGWDLNNDAPDVYVFLPRGDYRRLRRDFLKLTGPTEMPPLFAFGAFDSRWYDYSEAAALKQVDDYRARGIPLDVLVVDTGWRKGASTGYEPNADLFPNMRRFLSEAKARHARVMFNDHPQPATNTALAPEELKYRYNGLAGLLNEGLDFWWFDRNWKVALKTPAVNLRKEVWGMRLFHDATQKVRPASRPLIMANVDGIDSGIPHHPMDAAAHRFPIQWTGDIRPGYDYLRRAVENAVYSGVCSLFPYQSDDLGGHTADPTPAGYIRWIEYGALSPVYRPHCTHNHERMPWAFGAEAERVARRFITMRYRLLPAFYAAAHENYETGEPLLRRLDLDYPQFEQSRRNDEYLLGKSILVAPALSAEPQIEGGPANPETPRELWLPPGQWINCWNGRRLEGPRIVTNLTPLDQIPLYVKGGSLLPLAPEMEFTGQKPWDPITLDYYPGEHAAVATIYEDDTQSTGYQRGEFRNTLVSATAQDAERTLRVVIGAAQGRFKGALQKRSWILRVHPPPAWLKASATVDLESGGKKMNWPVKRLPQNPTAMPFGDSAGAPDGEVLEVAVPSSKTAAEPQFQVLFR